MRRAETSTDGARTSLTAADVIERPPASGIRQIELSGRIPRHGWCSPRSCGGCVNDAAIAAGTVATNNATIAKTTVIDLVFPLVMETSFHDPASPPDLKRIQRSHILPRCAHCSTVPDLCRVKVSGVVSTRPLDRVVSQESPVRSHFSTLILLRCYASVFVVLCTRCGRGLVKVD